MNGFEFITDNAFRGSLESDYSELQKCLKAECWKAAMVLAGSLVEAVLLDYLVAVGYQGRSNKDPLNMDLDHLIQACIDEGALSDTAAQVAQAVRSFRNLIHPGRVLRLEEKVDAPRARVAGNLVDILVDEVSQRRQETLGITAEQIVSKILRDSSAAPIVLNILKQAHQSELVRLLSGVLPKMYFGVVNEAGALLDGIPYNDWRLSVLRRCYREAFSLLDDGSKRKVVEVFLRVLKEEDGFTVTNYEQAFFRSGDLKYIEKQDDAELVKKHLLGRLEEGVSQPILNAIRGIGPFLELNDLPGFLNPLVNGFLAHRDVSMREACRRALVAEHSSMNEKVANRTQQALETRAKALDIRGSKDYAARIRDLIVPLDEIPF